MLLLRRSYLLRGSLTDGLGQSLAGETVLSGHDSVHEALTGHIRTVKQLVDVHD